MLKEMKLGQRLILTLDNGKVFGTLILIKLDYLRLKDVTDFDTKERIGNNCIFYLSKIRSINIVTDDGNVTPQVNGNSASNENNLVETKTPPVPKTAVIRIPHDILLQLNEMKQSYKYIKSCDSEYFNAVKRIKRCRVIGLSIENVEGGRESRLPALLSIATEKCVYIFDMVAMKDVKTEMKEIFELKQIQKIVHFSKFMIDFLRHKWDVKLINFFDVAMAYMCVMDTKEVLPMDKLVQSLFNLEIKLPSEVKWYQRPASDALLQFAATKVVYLIEIQRTLVNDHMLKAFYDKSCRQMKKLSQSLDFPMEVLPINENPTEKIEFEEIRKKLNEVDF